MIEEKNFASFSELIAPTAANITKRETITYHVSLDERTQHHLQSCQRHQPQSLSSLWIHLPICREETGFLSIKRKVQNGTTNTLAAKPTL